MKFFKQKSNNDYKLRYHKGDFTVDEFAQNMHTVYQQRSFEDMKQASWYFDNHSAIVNTHTQIARLLSFPNFTKLVALISPSVSWENNIQYAVDIVTQQKNPGVYAKAFSQALDIVNKNEFEFSDRAHKTRAFYDNLLNPVKSRQVTIDKHMGIAALGIDYVSLGCAVAMPKCVYYDISEATAKLARLYNLLPHQLQAVLWTTKKRLQKETPEKTKVELRNQLFNY